jgi:hypothetical protein
MNRVNCIFLFLFFNSISAGAQQFNYGYSFGGSPNSYSITLPLGEPLWLIPAVVTGPPKPAKGTPATSVFVEFGDGTFSFLPNGDHDFYPASINGNLTVKTARIYGGGGPPPKFQSYQVGAMKSPALGTLYSPMGILKSLEKIAITPNIGSVVANDTMIFALTYKLLPEESGKTLLFLYNDNGLDAFEKVSIGDLMDIDPSILQPYTFVRTYTGETETVINPSTPVESVRDINKQYTDALAFSNLKADSLEHNIFITLIPKEGLVARDLSETNVKAYLVEEQKGEIDTASASANLPIFNLSHDPNYITVKPLCLTLPKAGKKLEYHVHFQNTGPGAASEVRVAVKIPGNVNIGTDISFPSCPKNPPHFYKVPKGDLSILCTSPYANSSLDSLVFIFQKNAFNCTLDGMTATPTCMCNDSTIGDFWFTINTTNQMPDILLAQASIVFYNNADGLPNDPIITNTAISQFRECCECKKSCDPCKNKKGFWKWLFCDKCGTEKKSRGNLRQRL